MSLSDAVPGVAQGKLILAGLALGAFAVPTIGWTITAHTLKSRTHTLKSRTHTLKSRTEQRDTLQRWQDNVRQVTSAAAGVADKKGKPALLAVDQVAMQIQYLGGNLAECHVSLERKNAESARRGNDLATATANYQAEIARLEREGAGRADRLAYWQGMAEKYQADGECPINATLAKELNR